MTPIKKMRERYENDPNFHTMVNLFVNAINNLEMTPSEIREAAMFAAIKVDYDLYGLKRIYKDETLEERIDRELVNRRRPPV